MKIYQGETFAEVYRDSLKDLLYSPEYESAPRGLKIKENLNTILVVEDPTQCMYNNKRRSSQYRYLAAELLWYFTGRNDLKFIEKYAAFWRQIQNTDGTLNSAYGNLLFTQKNKYGISQWQWAIDSLIKDKDSRQALMTFNRPRYSYKSNKDFICTLNGLFNIRDNKLNLTINMRSNDAILGAPTDIAFFCLLLQQAHKLLQKHYPDLELGTYTHIANSYHIYDRHFELVEEMLKEDFTSDEFLPIGLDFINEKGEATTYLKELMDSVEKGTPSITRDPLHKWIKEQCDD